MGYDRVRALVTSICLASLIAGCSAGHDPAGGKAGQNAGRVPAPSDEALVKDGYFTDAGGTATHFRVEVERVERFRDSSVLRFAVTLLDAEEKSNLSEFGSDDIDSTFSGFHLIDSVGRRYYSSLRHDDDQGEAFGSDHFRVTLNTGVRYEARVYYPALPPSAQRVTVIAPGTPSEFTGVPVTDPGPAPASTAVPDSPTAGQTVVLPETEPSGNVWRGGVADLFDSVDMPDRTTRTGAGRETEALRADLLFAFDSATLTSKALDTLDAVAGEIEDGADPAKPVVIVGHTDHKGTASYNQLLSQRRATAVADALRQALGGRPYILQVSGKGFDEPVAKETKPDGSDNPAGRASNRRVEVSYSQRSPGGATAPPGPGARSGTRAEPAAFHPSDGRPVAERTAVVPPTFGSTADDHLRLRVYPFYRDGAFMVAVFDLTNVGDRELGSLPSNVDYFEDFDRTGDTFGTFSAVDSASGAVYRPVQIGAGSINYADGTVWMKAANQPGRTYIYLSSPPDTTTSVTLDAGPFGKIPAVPVR